MNAYLEIMIRAICSILFLLLIAKILGKQTVSSMTFLDFATGITIGSITANLAFNEKIKGTHMTFALLVFAITSLLLSFIALKNHKMRRWISGSPTILIEGGKILDGNMRKVRYTLDSLDQALREKEIFNIEVVDYAVLEDNGMLSVLKKEEYQYVTKKDLKLRPHPQSFPVELIMDGKIMEQELESNGLTKEWLETELRRKGKKITDVFYAVRGTGQQLVFDFYDDDIHNPIDKE